MRIISSASASNGCSNSMNIRIGLEGPGAAGFGLVFRRSPATGLLPGCSGISEACATPRLARAPEAA